MAKRPRTEREHPWTCPCKMCASVQVAFNRLIGDPSVLERFHVRVIQQHRGLERGGAAGASGRRRRGSAELTLTSRWPRSLPDAHCGQPLRVCGVVRRVADIRGACLYTRRQQNGHCVGWRSAAGQ